MKGKRGYVLGLNIASKNANPDLLFFCDFSYFICENTEIILGPLEPLRMKSIGCPETSVPNYQSALSNISEE
jgi:hypothetical protein